MQQKIRPPNRKGIKTWNKKLIDVLDNFPRQSKSHYNVRKLKVIENLIFGF